MAELIVTCEPGEWTLLTPSGAISATIRHTGKRKHSETALLLKAVATNAAPPITDLAFATSVPLYPGQVILSTDTQFQGMWPTLTEDPAYLFAWVPEFQSSTEVGVITNG